MQKKTNEDLAKLFLLHEEEHKKLLDLSVNKFVLIDEEFFNTLKQHLYTNHQLISLMYGAINEMLNREEKIVPQKENQSDDCCKQIKNCLGSDKEDKSSQNKNEHTTHDKDKVEELFQSYLKKNIKIKKEFDDFTSEFKREIADDKIGSFTRLDVEEKMKNFLDTEVVPEAWFDGKITNILSGNSKNEIRLKRGTGAYWSKQVKVNKDMSDCFLVAPKKTLKSTKEIISKNGILAFFDFDALSFSENGECVYELIEPAVFYLDKAGYYNCVVKGKLKFVGGQNG